MSYDHWCTPEWLCNLIGDVGLDPCSNASSFVKSNCKFTNENNDNGLTVDWNAFESVYVNPPYSNPSIWADKWSSMKIDGLWLSEASIGTRWMGKILRSANWVIAFDRRLAFFDPRREREVKGARSGHIMAGIGMFDVMRRIKEHGVILESNR